ncbi:putative integral membrane protein (TIGR00698 family) [Sagittula marina]|uniref:Putative integral membrane protein (TIGR00698 family) n=1 Tax=Sagittula marina TaxID=943940 RepID=A0A7W6DRZ6_9RHOB|nr:YeiH family protein [Sagittula marina]MBB3988116.1 putative integral membrane protein (TIGR00698 family) [Sagittula marina]
MTTLTNTMPRVRGIFQRAETVWPGLLVCGLAALAAQFLSDHYGAPAMLMALLIGLSLHFLVDDGERCAPGIGLAAKTVLRLGVALLGARISFEVFAQLGWQVVGLVVGGLLATMAFGWAAARSLGRGWRLAILTAGSVSICGASAAMAIAAVLPRNDLSERNLSFTVFGVTLLSTVAMVVYPILSNVLGLTDLQSGVFLGGTIHDVAQVVGAGFSVSEPVGETATTVKLIRVSMLAPFVLILTLVLRRTGMAEPVDGKRPPILPGFVMAFLGLALVNSLGAVPTAIQGLLWALSKWAMLTAIAAVGMKTDLKRILAVPPQSVALIFVETVFIAGFVLAGVMVLV